MTILTLFTIRLKSIQVCWIWLIYAGRTIFCFSFISQLHNQGQSHLALGKQNAKDHVCLFLWGGSKCWLQTSKSSSSWSTGERHSSWAFGLGPHGHLLEDLDLRTRCWGRCQRPVDEDVRLCYRFNVGGGPNKNDMLGLKLTFSFSFFFRNCVQTCKQVCSKALRAEEREKGSSSCVVILRTYI